VADIEFDDANDSCSRASIAAARFRLRADFATRSSMATDPLYFYQRDHLKRAKDGWPSVRRHPFFLLRCYSTISDLVVPNTARCAEPGRSLTVSPPPCQPYQEKGSRRLACRRVRVGHYLAEETLVNPKPVIFMPSPPRKSREIV